MRSLELRIAKLEAGRVDQVNDFFYGIVCQFADSQGKPLPQKQDNIVSTLRQLAGVLPL